MSRTAHRFWWLAPTVLYIWATIQVAFIAVSSIHILQPLELDNPLAGYSIIFPQGNSWSDMVSLWDGQWYRAIVERGYDLNYSLEQGIQENSLTTWAFFPLYPLAIGVLVSLGLPFWLAGSLLSIVSSFIGVLLLFKVAYNFSKSIWSASFAILPILASPAFFIMQSAYTEGFGLLLLSLVVFGLTQRRYLLVASALILVGFTRGLGVPLFILVVGYLAFELYKHRKLTWRMLAMIPAAIFAAAFWPLTVGWTLGSLTASLDILALWTLSEKYPLWVPLLTVVGVIALYIGRKLPGPWKAWSVIYMLYMTLVTVVSAGLIRYAMLSLVPLPNLFSKFPTKPRAIASTLLILLVFGVGAYGQLWWTSSVWIPTSALRWKNGIP